MSDDEVSRLIDEVDENRDGKLDYKEVIIHQNLILFFRNVIHFILQCNLQNYQKLIKSFVPLFGVSIFLNWKQTNEFVFFVFLFLYATAIVCLV